MFWIQVFLAFVAGMIVCKLMGGLLSFGYSTLMLQQAHNDSLKIVGIICEELSEIQEMKRLELQRMGKSKKEIEISQNVSNYHLKSVQNTVIRNLISVFPKRRSDILMFSDWESAMQHLDRLIKEERQKKFKQ